MNTPSNDGRFQNLVDMGHHCDGNFDWGNDWALYDRRLRQMNRDEGMFLGFLCKTLHPLVRADATEAEQVSQFLMQHLHADEFQLIKRAHLLGRPVCVGSLIGMMTTQDALALVPIRTIYRNKSPLRMLVIDGPRLSVGRAPGIVGDLL